MCLMSKIHALIWTVANTHMHTSSHATPRTSQCTPRPVPLYPHRTNSISLPVSNQSQMMAHKFEERLKPIIKHRNVSSNTQIDSKCICDIDHFISSITSFYLFYHLFIECILPRFQRPKRQSLCVCICVCVWLCCMYVRVSLYIRVQVRV